MPSTHRLKHDLRLAAHVRACAHDGQVVLLDLQRSRYLGVGGPLAATLAPLVSGWPVHDDRAQPGTSSQADTEALAAPLMRQGLITRDAGPSSVRPVLPEAAQTFNAEHLIGTAPLGASRVFRFLRSYASATACLRVCSLLSIANRVAARRGRAVTTGRVNHLPLGGAVAAYLRLRPLMFTAHDRCLQDSLTLLEFLAAEGWYPNWVIGVATQPFRAHAWVQTGVAVLSDLHENVRRYTPILVA